MRLYERKNGVDDAAAAWVIRRDAGLSAAERAEFERWLDSDPRHRAAIADMDAAFDLLAQPSRVGRAQETIAELAAWERHRHAHGRRRASLVALGLGAAAAIVLAVSTPWQTKPRDVAAAVAAAQSGSQVLPDGSIVELRAGAEIRVEFSAGQRGVRLLRGDAHFAVAKRTGWPFVVAVNDVHVEAVGTEFAIRKGDQSIDVFVTEGVVAIGSAADRARPTDDAPAETRVLVTAGSRATMAASPVRTEPVLVRGIPATEIEQELSWRDTRLEFSGTRLAEALEAFNRRSLVKLTLADPTLAELRISGYYRAASADGFAKLIEASLGLKSMREGPEHISLRSP